MKFKEILKLILLTLTVNFIWFIYDVIYNPPEKGGPHPDYGYNISEVLAREGYPFEEHSITTEDGYILTLHRIPYGRVIKNEVTNGTKRPVVLIVHGLCGNSFSWLIPGPKLSLPYLMADEGYDVWLFNNRGNIYARKHINLDIEKDPAAFYDFSVHEIAYYDLADTIDRVRQVTGDESIYYVGHSLGASVLTILLSVKPEYNERIKIAVTMAPVLNFIHTSTPLYTIPTYSLSTTKWLIKLFNINILAPRNEFLISAGVKLCGNDGRFQEICYKLLGFFGGNNRKTFNTDWFPLLLNYYPGPSSIKQILHFYQVIGRDVLEGYDYGETRNLIVYGSKEPMKYDLKKVTAPIGIFYGLNDYFTTVEDIKRSFEMLPNIVMKYEVPDKETNHLDFLMSKTAAKIIYSEIFKLFKKY